MGKPWINKLVTLCSHDHFQFEFHLIAQIYHSIDPEHFSGETCLQKKSKNWFQSIFKSLNAIVSFYTVKLFTQDFSWVFTRRTYNSVQGCFFFCEEITLSALKVWNEFNKCGKYQNVAKYIKNMSDTLCIQLSTFGIKRIGLIRFTNNCHLIMAIS